MTSARSVLVAAAVTGSLVAVGLAGAPPAAAGREYAVGSVVEQTRVSVLPASWTPRRPVISTAGTGACREVAFSPRARRVTMSCTFDVIHPGVNAYTVTLTGRKSGRTVATGFTVVLQGVAAASVEPTPSQSPVPETSAYALPAAHSADMAANNYVSHDDLNGSDVLSRGMAIGYDYLYGENIAAGQTTVAEVVEEWRTSPLHYAAMIEPNFTFAGFGVALNPAAEYQLYWTQDFAYSDTC